ncbi:S1 RNA-binding domain-containing protein [Glaciecola sp. SC05]|uniref:CvfB family protein n=1 Tax=Glaciecola sp. SC05 TaxID=1987355 RepID=UPI003527F140
MLSIGKINTLQVKEATPVGYVLCDPQSIALPSNPWTENVRAQAQEILLSATDHSLTEGQSVEVFLYYGQDKAIHASMLKPTISVDEFKALTVIGLTDAGAFFKWGIERDLFAPKQHTHSELAEGMPAVVRLIHEPTQNRMFATTKIEQFLLDAPAQWDYSLPVELLVYGKSPLGYKVIINNSFGGLLYHSDLFKPVHIGETHTGYITKIREDGKIDVSLQRHDAKQRQSLNQQILEDLEAHGGISTLTDKSSPDDIQTRFNVSKAAYKRALGQLYKSKQILITPTHIKRNSEST